MCVKYKCTHMTSKNSCPQMPLCTFKNLFMLRSFLLSFQMRSKALYKAVLNEVIFLKAWDEAAHRRLATLLKGHEDIFFILKEFAVLQKLVRINNFFERENALYNYSIMSSPESSPIPWKIKIFHLPRLLEDCHGSLCMASGITASKPSQSAFLLQNSSG